MAVYTWVGPEQWENLSGNLAMVGKPDLTEIADLDLDGFGDVIALYETKLDVYLGDGQGNWQLVATMAMPDACDTAALRAGTDIDHNGYPDFVCIVEDDCDPWTGGTNTPHLWKETSTPDAPFIHPKRPRGGEMLIAGAVCFIDWHAAVPAGKTQPTMMIEFSSNGPDGPFETIAAGAPDNGRYQWLIPADLPASEDCHLRFTLSTDPPTIALTPGPFTIINPNLIPGDVNGDGVVNTEDLLLLLGSWGPCPDPPEECPADFNGDGFVNTGDLLILLGNWG